MREWTVGQTFTRPDEGLSDGPSLAVSWVIRQSTRQIRALTRFYVNSAAIHTIMEVAQQLAHRLTRLLRGLTSSAIGTRLSDLRICPHVLHRSVPECVSRQIKAIVVEDRIKQLKQLRNSIHDLDIYHKFRKL